MEDLPRGWREVAFADVVADVRNGLSAKPADQPPGLPILRISAVRARRINLQDARFHRDAGVDAQPYLLRNRDLLFVRYNGTPDLTAACGMVRSLDADCVYPDKLIRVRVDESTALPEFVELAMTTEAARKRLQAHIKTAAGQHGISGRDLLRVKLPLPPLAEQRRIVARIEALFARTRRARAELERVEKLAAQCVTRALEQAFDAGGQPQALKPVSDLASAQLGKMLDAAKNTDGRPLPYLRNINVRWFGFDLSDLLTMRFTEEEAIKFTIRDDDVFVCEGGEPGRAAVWHGGATDIKFQKALHRLRPKADVEPDWLALGLRYLADSGQLADHFTGTTIKHLPGQALAAVRLPLFPLEEQRARITAFQRTSKRIETQCNETARALALLDRLDAAILARAFRGELVPQDPADEPARLSHPLAAIARPRRRAASPA